MTRSEQTNDVKRTSRIISNATATLSQILWSIFDWQTLVCGSTALARGDLLSRAIVLTRTFAVCSVQSFLLVTPTSPSLSFPQSFVAQFSFFSLRRLRRVWLHKRPRCGIGFHSNSRHSRVPSFALGPLHCCLVPLHSSNAPTPLNNLRLERWILTKLYAIGFQYLELSRRETKTLRDSRDRFPKESIQRKMNEFMIVKFNRTTDTSMYVNTFSPNSALMF